jgi:hypothetical protein
MSLFLEYSSRLAGLSEVGSTCGTRSRYIMARCHLSATVAHCSGVAAVWAATAAVYPWVYLGLASRGWGWDVAAQLLELGQSLRGG